MESAEVGVAKTVSAIRPETWEQINRAVLSGARQAKLEDGAVVRLANRVACSTWAASVLVQVRVP